MEIFVTTFAAKPGKADVVAEYYVERQPEYEAAKGFRGMPGHVLAKNNRHTAAVASHCQIVLEAAEKGIIDKQQLSELLPPGWQTEHQGNNLWQKG